MELLFTLCFLGSARSAPSLWNFITMHYSPTEFYFYVVVAVGLFVAFRTRGNYNTWHEYQRSIREPIL